MLSHCEPRLPSSFQFSSHSRPQYVHCTGGMFVLIPDNYATSPRNQDGTHCQPKGASYFDYIAWQRAHTQRGTRGSSSVSTGSSYSDGGGYFHRRNSRSDGQVHVDTTAYDVPGSSLDERVGFLWAWNYMLTKRCRSVHTGDENFQDKVLSDFRHFCSNKDGRLVALWKECWALKQTEDGERCNGNGNTRNVTEEHLGVISEGDVGEIIK